MRKICLYVPNSAGSRRRTRTRGTNAAASPPTIRPDVSKNAGREVMSAGPTFLRATARTDRGRHASHGSSVSDADGLVLPPAPGEQVRSEERRVGKEWRSRW